jgi:hypothetical protein
MPQPEWSAYRESSFGVGSLALHNATHAYYNWTRDACMVQNANVSNIDMSDPAHCISVSRYGELDNAEDAGAHTLNYNHRALNYNQVWRAG